MTKRKDEAVRAGKYQERALANITLINLFKIHFTTTGQNVSKRPNEPPQFNLCSHTRIQRCSF